MMVLQVISPGGGNFSYDVTDPQASEVPFILLYQQVFMNKVYLR